MSVYIPAYYYAQQGADKNAKYPALTFGGWGKTQIPLDLSRTAIVVMHMWKVPESEALYRHVEYLSRAETIVREKFSAFLQQVRQSNIRIIHVAAGFERVVESFPGYQRMIKKYPPQQSPTIKAGEQMQSLRALHWKLTGADTQERHDELENCYAEYDFMVKPLDTEDVVIASEQLFALCRDEGIEHLIYTGFAVNACLTLSPCGMRDMARYGLMCSVVGDLTTAVENKESCVEQRNLEYGLWQFAVQSGFVFLSEDLKRCL